VPKSAPPHISASALDERRKSAHNTRPKYKAANVSKPHPAPVTSRSGHAQLIAGIQLLNYWGVGMGVRARCGRSPLSRPAIGFVTEKAFPYFF